MGDDRRLIAVIDSGVSFQKRDIVLQFIKGLVGRLQMAMTPMPTLRRVRRQSGACQPNHRTCENCKSDRHAVRPKGLVMIIAAGYERKAFASLAAGRFGNRFLGPAL